MKLGCFSWLFILAAFSTFAADPATKPSPSPDQGTIDSAGKFTPAAPAIDTNANATGNNPALDIKQTGDGTFQIGLVALDQKQRTVSLPATICNRDQVIEYALVTAGGKTYESLLSTKASPLSVHLAFLLLGVNPMPLPGEMKQSMSVPGANAVQIEVSWEINGVTLTLPLAKLIRLTNGDENDPGKPLSLDQWFYNGSIFDQHGFAARREGSLVALIRDPVALLNNPGADRTNDLIHSPDKRLVPEAGTPVSVVLHLAKPPPSAVPPQGMTPITPLSTNRF